MTCVTTVLAFMFPLISPPSFALLFVALILWQSRPGTSVFVMDRTSSLQSSKQLSVLLAPQGGAVQLRPKNPQGPGDRLSQSRSMVLQEADLQQKPVSTPEAAACRGRCTFLSSLCSCRCVATAGISPSTTSCVEEGAGPSLSLW